MHSYSKKIRLCGFLVENVEAVGKKTPLWGNEQQKTGLMHRTKPVFYFPY